MNRTRYLLLALFTIIAVTFYITNMQLHADPLSDNKGQATTANETEPIDQAAFLEILKNLLANYNYEQQYRSQTLTKTGIATANKVNIREQPLTNNDELILTTVSEGESFTITGENQQWYKILFDETEGWIRKEYVTPSATLAPASSDGASLELTFLSNNQLQISSQSTLDLTLINHANGMYSFQADSISVNEDLTFDLSHPDIPLLKLTNGQLDIYTKGWLHAELIEQSTSSYILSFIPIVYQMEYAEIEDRDKIILHTSGVPGYTFTNDDTNIQIVFAPNVQLALEKPDIKYSPKISDLNLHPDAISFTSSIPVNWKVTSDSNRIIIDMSEKGIAGKKIVIDPGHGGSEKGTYGRKTNMLEKEFNLLLANQLKISLEKLGAVVYMTRQSDTTVYQGDNYETYKDLEARVEFSNERDADMFISVHGDNFPADLSISGTTGYYYEGVPHSHQSKKLAAMISENVAEEVSTKWLGAQEQSFVVIRYNPVPSALIEYGFMSNKEDEQKMTTDATRQKMAQATAKAIASYYQQ